MLNDPAAIGQIRLLLAADAALAPAMGAALGAGPLRHLRPARATGGLEAEHVLRTGRFDLLIIGLGLFARGGAEAGLARLVRLSAGALVLAVSDAGSVSDSMAALRGGAHDCLALPVDPDTLATRLGELARRHAKSGPLTALVPLAPPQVAPEPARGPATVQMLPTSRAHAQTIEPMWRQEQKIIEEAVALCGGNIARAAAALQISPSTIYRKRQSWQDQSDGWSEQSWSAA